MKINQKDQELKDKIAKIEKRKNELAPIDYIKWEIEFYKGIVLKAELKGRQEARKELLDKVILLVSEECCFNGSEDRQRTLNFIHSKLKELQDENEHI